MNEIFQKARTYLYRHARPLELARFQYHFEGGSRENVLNVLQCYQNPDGGFGHGIEADCWNPNSIPLHSAGAAAIMAEVGLEDQDHPMVQALAGWFASGAHFNGKSWAITVESSNAHPHAPWWHTESESSCHTDYNGTAQIAGFLIHYAKPDTAAFRLGARVAAEAIAALDPAALNDKHTCACYVQMAEMIRRAGTTHLFAYDELTEKLHSAVHSLIETDVSKWHGYVCRPSEFLRSRQSEYYAENRAMAEYECDFIAQTQLPDGSWPIPWSWADYPEEWAVSKMWWKGVVILQNLLYLKGFDRI